MSIFDDLKTLYKTAKYSYKAGKYADDHIKLAGNLKPSDKIAKSAFNLFGPASPGLIQKVDQVIAMKGKVQDYIKQSDDFGKRMTSWALNKVKHPFAPGNPFPRPQAPIGRVNILTTMPNMSKSVPVSRISPTNPKLVSPIKHQVAMKSVNLLALANNRLFTIRTQTTPSFNVSKSKAFGMTSKKASAISPLNKAFRIGIKSSPPRSTVRPSVIKQAPKPIPVKSSFTRVAPPRSVSRPAPVKMGRFGR